MDEDRELRLRVDRLENLLIDKSRLTFHDNAYWDKDAGPFCSRCFDVDAKRVHMTDVSNTEITENYIYRCNNCQSKIYTQIELPADRKTI